MDYEDFTIDLRSAEGGGFEATVAEAPIRDNLRVTFAEPVARETLARVQHARDRPLETSAAPPSEISPRSLGDQVFAAIFREELAGLFLRCRDAVSRDGKGLRVRLRFRADDPEAEYLAALPWEWMRDPRFGFLAMDPSTPVVRELTAPWLRSTLEVEPPLRILVVDAAAATLRQLGLELEIERMSEALAPLVADGLVELLTLRHNTADELRDALHDEDVHVLDFMGHGGYDAGSGAGAIFFVDEDGKEDQVDGEELAAFLKTPSRSLRLAVLNACKTARYAGRMGSPLNSGVAPAVLGQTGVPAVLATQYTISGSAATEFSRIFYGRLAAGDAVDEALTEARLRLWRRTSEWATPVLFLSAPNGRIFDLPPGRRPSTAVRVASSRPEASPVRLGVRSIDGHGRDMGERTDEVLELVSYFEKDRYIRDKAWWQERIFPELRAFLARAVDARRPLLLDFAAHSSIAFAAGWLLEPKSGLDVRVRQRIGGEGELEWHPKDGSEPAGALWLDRPDRELDPAGADVAVAIAVSQEDVPNQAQAFIRDAGLPVGRLVDATIAPEPGQTSVKGGAHALRLAQALLPRLRPRQPHERGGKVHVFSAAPNALFFYLGQLASSLGQVVLYEYPFKAPGSYGRYQRSIELPPPGEAPEIPEGF